MFEVQFQGAAGPFRLPGAQEVIAQCARAQRQAGLVRHVQPAFGVQVVEDAALVEHRHAGRHVAQEHQGLRIVVDQLPVGGRRLGQREDQRVERAGVVLERVDQMAPTR